MLLLGRAYTLSEAGLHFRIFYCTSRGDDTSEIQRDEVVTSRGDTQISVNDFIADCLRGRADWEDRDLRDSTRGARSGWRSM